ncbi:hypothetical protein HN51_016436 [Arachis hypogaea]
MEKKELDTTNNAKAALHPLKNKFVLWYTRRTPGVRNHTSDSYEDSIKKIVHFSTVEGFWVCYCHLSRPSSLLVPTDLHLFKEGIRPLWEILLTAMVVSGLFDSIRLSQAGFGKTWFLP